MDKTTQLSKTSHLAQNIPYEFLSHFKHLSDIS